MFSYPILIGDIGGTNSRFALIASPNADMVTFPSAKNAEFASIGSVIEATVLANCDLHPKTLLLAVAGPTGDPKGIKMTNCPWDIDVHALIHDLDIREAIAMSDFEAQALAAIATDPAEHSLIKQGVHHPTAARSVLGPGTGLGLAGMIYADGQWTIIPGEGGFVDMGPRTKRDREIYDHAYEDGERSAAELFISGRGLTNLYNAISSANGSEKRIVEPADVSKAYEEGDDEARETMELFATYLGRFASDAALIYLARGGIYLTGGVAQKLESVLKLPFFGEAFTDKEPYNDFISDIPIYLMTEPFIALDGLCAYANEPEQFRISKQGRHWQNAG